MFSHMIGSVMHCGILAAAITIERGSLGSVPLGGGPAGFVSTLTGCVAIGFDHLPFAFANENQAQRLAA